MLQTIKMKRDRVLVVYFVALFISLVFTAVAIPTAIWQSKVGSGCITFWGFKQSCWEPQISADVLDNLTCNEFKNNIVNARVFAILAMFVTVAGLFAWTLAIVKKREDLDLAIVGAGGTQAFLSLVTFALEATAYTQSMCGGQSMKDGDLYKYGPSFILSIFAFLTGISLVIFHLIIWRSFQCCDCMTRVCDAMCKNEAPTKINDVHEPASASTPDVAPEQKMTEESTEKV